jgi:CheY-like chemotaxis protein
MGTVLVLDDDASSALLTSAALEVGGHRALVVSDPLDLVAGGGTGTASCSTSSCPAFPGFLFRALRDAPQTRRIPVMFVSALDEPEHRAGPALERRHS